MSSWPGVEGCHWERGGQVWNEDDEKIRREKNAKRKKNDKNFMKQKLD